MEQKRSWITLQYINIIYRTQVENGGKEKGNPLNRKYCFRVVAKYGFFKIELRASKIIKHKNDKLQLGDYLII